MNMTDMLMQMTVQGAWNITSQSVGQKTDHVQQGTTFQDLLQQRQNQVTQETGKSGTANALEDPQGQEQEVGSQEGQDQQETTDLQAAALGSMLLADYLTPVQTVQVEQVQTPLSQTEAVAVVQGDAVQTVQSAPLTQTQSEEVVQLAPNETAPQPQTVQEAAPQAENQTTAMPTVQTQGNAGASMEQQSSEQDSQAPELVRQEVQPQQSQNQDMEGAAVTSWQTPLFQDVETSPVRVGDAQVDMTAPAQETEKALGDTLKTALSQGEQRVEIKLSPANLGTVVAEFTRSPEGVLHVVLHAETEHTAKLLGDHAAALGVLLQDGTRGEVRVEVPQAQNNQQAWQQPDQNGGQRQQQQQQQHSAPRQEAESFLHQLRLGLVETQAEAV